VSTIFPSTIVDNVRTFVKLKLFIEPKAPHLYKDIMLKQRTPSHQEQILALAMRQIEKMLKEMQSNGKNLSRLKLKKFQKTHHIDCKCKLCEDAKIKNDPRLRGLLEDGFKVYVEGAKKIVNDSKELI